MSTAPTNTHTCYGCQASIPLGERVCPYCRSRQPYSIEVRIARLFAGIFPKRFPATRILMAAILVYFGVYSLDIFLQPDYGLKEVLLSPPGALIYRWGAHRQGEFTWWRLITANFVHIGVIHIAFNAYALRIASAYVERSFGAAMTFASFVAFGSASMLCSNIFGDSALVAGASGGLMAFIGMAAVAAHREKTALSIEIRNSMLKWAAITMVFGIMLTVSGSMGVDNIAHFSGFVIGAAAGFVLPTQTTTGYSSLAAMRGARFACLAAVVLCVVAFVRMAGASQSMQHQTECIAALQNKDPIKAEPQCALAFEADSSMEISYHNYILSLFLNGRVDKARALCKEGRKKFPKPSFENICHGVDVAAREMIKAQSPKNPSHKGELP